MGSKAIPRRFSAVIFDLDGTLIDSSRGVLSSFRRTLTAHGLSPVVPLDRSLIGPPLATTMKTITGISVEDALSSLMATFKADYDAHGCFDAIPYADVCATLPRLVDMGLRLFIATNKRLIPTRRILSHFQWDPYFSAIYTVDSAGSAVSDKVALVSNIVRAERLEASATAMVGDSMEDARAAAHSSLAFFAALWGYGNVQLAPSTYRPLNRFSELRDQLQD